MKTFPNIDLETFRSAGDLPGRIDVGDRSQEGNEANPFFGHLVPGAYEFVQRVYHEDREEFEKNMSIQYNRSIQISEYSTGLPIGNKTEYWPVYLHLLDITGTVGRDITSDVTRNEAFEHLLDTNEISFSASPIAWNGIKRTSFSQLFPVLETPDGKTGLVVFFTRVDRIEATTNTLLYIKGGNNGRRVLVTQVDDGVNTLVYNKGTESAKDLIFEKSIVLNQRTSFIVSCFDDTNYDNTNDTVTFMFIGLAVSILFAIWEFFRSSESIKAIESSEAKSKFLSSISHEIRTPINGIVGITDVLSKEALPTSISNFVEIIKSCSSSLLSLLNNVLDMSKIDAGKMENNKRLFLLKAVVLRTVRDSWQVLLSRNSSLTHINVIITKDVPDEKIFGNNTHLFQIINNLMSNAVKFTDKGYIECKVDACETKKQGQIKISVSIRDTGCGMSKEAIAKLFKPFNRVHNSNVQKDGTGLGLVISMNLCKIMGGSIECESELGEGTTFIASFVVDSKLRTGGSEELYVFDRKNIPNLGNILEEE